MDKQEYYYMWISLKRQVEQLRNDVAMSRYFVNRNQDYREGMTQAFNQVLELMKDLE